MQRLFQERENSPVVWNVRDDIGNFQQRPKRLRKQKENRKSPRVEAQTKEAGKKETTKEATSTGIKHNKVKTTTHLNPKHDKHFAQPAAEDVAVVCCALMSAWRRFFDLMNAFFMLLW